MISGIHMTEKKHKTVVLKFGGTSVATKDTLCNMMKIIEEHKKNRMSIVVSALGEARGCEKVTDSLISLRTSDNPEKTLSGLKKRHYDLIDECIRDKKYSDAAKKEIDRILSDIRDSMKAKDFPVECFGEIMSVQLIRYMLMENGFDVSYVDALKVIHFKNNAPDVDKIKQSSHIIKSVLESGKITITEGFIADDCGKVVCMSRGGSDYTATLIGLGIDADEVLIYSDRDGIMSADPRVVKSAKTIPEISYPEAEEMAGHGAKIIYPKILEPLKGLNIPVIIKNTFNPSHKGTTILPKTKNRGIKCVTSVRQVHTSIYNPAMIGTEGFLAKLFSAVDKDVDVVVSGNPIVGYTTDDCAKTPEKLREFGDVRQQIVHTIAIVGEEVEKNPEVLRKISVCLAELDLEIEFMSHDRKSAAIYFGIKENVKTNQLLNMLHKELIENRA